MLTARLRIDLPAAGLWTYFTNDTCRPTTNPTDSCTLGHYPVLVITAKTAAHIQSGVNFARKNNLRLTIRNTGHDFLGRSVGWGSLVINTHSFKTISTTNKWTGPGGYKGSAITAGAGVQAFEALARLNSLTPRKIMVTGECAVSRTISLVAFYQSICLVLTCRLQTVGIAGGLVQGGGHGPLTNFYGFLADTALEFKVITADGALKTANSAVNPDLFWALKGGGPAAFAVIVEASYKTFDDFPSSGLTLDINPSLNTNEALFWQAVQKFHSYSTRFVDNNIYVYYELGPVPMTLHVQPIVGVNMTLSQLKAIVQPLFNDLNAIGIRYASTERTFTTFYDLYNAMFEIEMSGNSALTGGWSIARTDVQNNHPAIINAFKTILNAGGFFVGHMWSAGQSLPQSEWSKSAMNPRFRSVVDKLITIVPVSGNAPLSEKAEAQNRLTNVVDASLRAASPNGASYINEVCRILPLCYFILFEEMLT